MEEEEEVVVGRIVIGCLACLDGPGWAGPGLTSLCLYTRGHHLRAMGVDWIIRHIYRAPGPEWMG
jgi:hypothetical protein